MLCSPPEFQKQLEMCLRFVINIYSNNHFLFWLKNLTENRYKKKCKVKQGHQSINELQMTLKNFYSYILLPKIKC